jgi:hypothetical protein
MAVSSSDEKTPLFDSCGRKMKLFFQRMNQKAGQSCMSFYFQEGYNYQGYLPGKLLSDH